MSAGIMVKRTDVVIEFTIMKSLRYDRLSFVKECCDLLLKVLLQMFSQEHFYDAQCGSGFLAWRLKTIQRKSKLHFESSSSPKATLTTGGGPTCVRNISPDNQLQDEPCKEAISLMTHTNDRETIFQKMRETFQYRQKLIHNPETSATVLSVFPRLLDTNGLVSLLLLIML